eukprot:GHUV01023074.1.p1 GENE.GHUV01023074.1~~GHUV01023074.1.p1  ORF type:complete len:124 (-),score=13.99 GHUV01023074.1:551-922(-)
MDSGPQAPASVSVASVAVASASNSGGSNRSRVRGIVVEAPAGVRSRALYRALKTSGDVSKVIQDRVISISQGEASKKVDLWCSSCRGPYVLHESPICACLCQRACICWLFSSFSSEAWDKRCS